MANKDRRKGLNLNDKISAASLVVGLIIAACLTYSVFIRNDAVYAEQIKAISCQQQQMQKAVNGLIVNAAKTAENRTITTDALRQVTSAINEMSVAFQETSMRMSVSLARVDERLGSVEKKLDIRRSN